MRKALMLFIFLCFLLPLGALFAQEDQSDKFGTGSQLSELAGIDEQGSWDVDTSSMPAFRRIIVNFINSTGGKVDNMLSIGRKLFWFFMVLAIVSAAIRIGFLGQPSSLLSLFIRFVICIMFLSGYYYVTHGIFVLFEGLGDQFEPEQNVQEIQSTVMRWQNQVSLDVAQIDKHLNSSHVDLAAKESAWRILTGPFGSIGGLGNAVAIGGALAHRFGGGLLGGIIGIGADTSKALAFHKLLLQLVLAVEAAVVILLFLIGPVCIPFFIWGPMERIFTNWLSLFFGVNAWYLIVMAILYVNAGIIAKVDKETVLINWDLNKQITQSIDKDIQSAKSSGEPVIEYKYTKEVGRRLSEINNAVDVMNWILIVMLFLSPVLAGGIFYFNGGAVGTALYFGAAYFTERVASEASSVGRATVRTGTSVAGAASG